MGRTTKRSWTRNSEGGGTRRPGAYTALPGLPIPDFFRKGVGASVVSGSEGSGHVVYSCLLALEVDARRIEAKQSSAGITLKALTP